MGGARGIGWLVGVGTALLLVQSGCERSSPGNDGAGSMESYLFLPGGAFIAAATYTVVGPNGFSRTGSVDVSHSSTVSFRLGGIPNATGYNVAVSVDASDGTACSGSSPFDVAAGATTTVALHLTCHEPLLTGSVQVNGTINVCPLITALSATASGAGVGEPIAITAVAHDLDLGPAPIVYSWSATSGSLSTSSGPTLTFTCSASGQAVVTLVVSDGDCSDTKTLTLNCVPISSSGDGGASCQPVLKSNNDTGFDRCSDGTLIRRAVLDCPDAPTSPTDVCASSPYPDAHCTSDADCTAQPLGYCANSRHLAGYCGCFYGCRKDADCAPGSICQCDVVVGRCFPATCSSSASCAGFECISTLTADKPDINSCTEGRYGYSCETAGDLCDRNSDCGAALGAACLMIGGQRVCGTAICPL